MQMNSNFQLPLDELIVARNSGFGDGKHGNIVFNGTYPFRGEDRSSYYEVHSTYFEIPAGYIFKPQAPCSGLIIYSLSDIVINGTIDMKYRGYLINSSAKDEPTFVTVLGKQYYLPVGGATMASAVGGNAGMVGGSGITSANGGGGSSAHHSYINGTHVTGGYSMSVFGLGAQYSSGSSATAGRNSAYSCEDGLERNPTGIVVLIARGKIVIRGKIDCSATPGIAAQSGKAGKLDASGSSPTAFGGDGGAGAQAPSGGGAITLIAKQIDRTGGILDVSGKSYTNTTKGAGVTGYNTFTVSGRSVNAYGGAGGEGTPAAGYTSQAGNIKEYLYWQ